MTSSLELSLPAVPASVREARHAAAKIATRLDATDRIVDDVKLCVSEAVANAVRHAYASETGIVDVAVERSGDELAVVVRDQGRGLAEFSREGELGFGLRIIARVARRYDISTGPNLGTKIQMFFALTREPRVPTP
jgi:anti-sigma regulatory factor (Ser/Thr protein kinase)